MIIRKVINRLKRWYYKRTLEEKCGRKLPKVKVMGELYFESCSVDIAEDVVLYPRVTFSGSGNISIGRGSKIGQDCIIFSNKEGGGVSIGEDTIIAAQTYIIDSNHRIEEGRLISDQGLDTEPIVIGNDVWIGMNCSVIKGAKINNHAVIGAKALVNSDIPEGAIAFGIPAKVHGKRNARVGAS